MHRTRKEMQVRTGKACRLADGDGHIGGGGGGVGGREEGRDGRTVPWQWGKSGLSIEAP